VAGARACRYRITEQFHDGQSRLDGHVRLAHGRARGQVARLGRVRGEASLLCRLYRRQNPLQEKAGGSDVASSCLLHEFPTISGTCSAIDARSAASFPVPGFLPVGLPLSPGCQATTYPLLMQSEFPVLLCHFDDGKPGGLRLGNPLRLNCRAGTSTNSITGPVCRNGARASARRASRDITRRLPQEHPHWVAFRAAASLAVPEYRARREAIEACPQRRLAA
jgi:hypothetical protein